MDDKLLITITCACVESPQNLAWFVGYFPKCNKNCTTGLQSLYLHRECSMSVGACSDRNSMKHKIVFYRDGKKRHLWWLFSFRLPTKNSSHLILQKCNKFTVHLVFSHEAIEGGRSELLVFFKPSADCLRVHLSLYAFWYISSILPTLRKHLVHIPLSDSDSIKIPRALIIVFFLFSVNFSLLSKYFLVISLPFESVNVWTNTNPQIMHLFLKLW